MMTGHCGIDMFILDPWKDKKNSDEAQKPKNLFQKKNLRSGIFQLRCCGVIAKDTA